MQKQLLLFIFIFQFLFLQAQNPAFQSSNLPIIVINTGNQSIPDEPKLQVQMGIIYNGPGVRNFITDPFNNYNNKIGIEVHGSSSQSFPQKTYGMETRDINGLELDTTLLGMPSEHDWILYAPYDDKTCLRNVLSYDIATKTGHYAPRTQFCELVLDGQYQGIYILMEKIKRDKNRVDISKLTPADTVGDNLSGGYIIKVDRDAGPEASWVSNYPSETGSAITFVHTYPDAGSITQQQRDYIRAYVDTVERVLADSNLFADPANGYRKYIGVNSFIDYFILDEISKNVDGYRLSTFLYKEKQSKGGKLKTGPAWDYNLAWWNADYCEGNLSTGWAYQFPKVCSGDGNQVPFWWERLMSDPSFTAQLKCRWVELRNTTLKVATLNTFIDSVAGYLDEAQARHFMAWPILGQYTWPNPSPIPADYPGEIAAIKLWIKKRIKWMDNNLPGTCNVGIEENNVSINTFSVSPNPFNNRIDVRFHLENQEKLKIEILDIFGRTIKIIEQTDFQAGEQTIPIYFSDNESNGVYLLKILSSQGVFVKKIIKE